MRNGSSENSDVKRISLVGRGGQGVVVGSRILVSALIKRDKYATSLPTFNFVRRGGPVKAFIRFSDSPILRKSQVYHSNYILAFDPEMEEELNSLLNTALNGSTTIYNTKKHPDQVKVPGNIHYIATVNATFIANGELGKSPIPLVNTTMLGALARTFNELKLSSLKNAYVEWFGQQKASPNIKAAKRAYDETVIAERGQQK